MGIIVFINKVVNCRSATLWTIVWKKFKLPSVGFLRVDFHSLPSIISIILVIIVN